MFVVLQPEGETYDDIDAVLFDRGLLMGHGGRNISQLQINLVEVLLANNQQLFVTAGQADLGAGSVLLDFLLRRWIRVDSVFVVILPLQTDMQAYTQQVKAARHDLNEIMDSSKR